MQGCRPIELEQTGSALRNGLLLSIVRNAFETLCEDLENMPVDAPPGRRPPARMFFGDPRVIPEIRSRGKVGLVRLIKALLPGNQRYPHPFLAHRFYRDAAQDGETETMAILEKLMDKEDCKRIQNSVNARKALTPLKRASLDQALVSAVENKSLKDTRELLEGGGSPDSTDHRGATLWHFLSGENAQTFAELLLKAGAMPEGHRYSEYWPPLPTAVLQNQQQVVDLLLQSGADPNVRYRILNSPLHSAATYGFLEIAKLLLNAGANPNNWDSETPLKRAVLHGRWSLAKLFLDRGADRSVTSYWRTLLHEAVFQGNEEGVKLFLDAGLDPEVGSRLYPEETPLKVARQRVRNREPGAESILKILTFYNASR